ICSAFPAGVFTLPSNQQLEAVKPTSIITVKNPNGQSIIPIDHSNLFLTKIFLSSLDYSFKR
ncbi:hypothetical protein P4605_25590, partial [Priestia aryabhattai]|nr:hypothetical protein [Priestia aryabhattai]